MPEFLWGQVVPTLARDVAELHGRYYAEHWGLDASFPAEVEGEVQDFVDTFDPERDGLWPVHIEDRLVGFIAMDGVRHHDLGARLRWFIVAPEFQGKGLGRDLLSAFVLRCQTLGYDKAYLWTFEGLDAARRLYEAVGFTLVETKPGQRWGREIVEQRFVLRFGLF